MKIQVTDPDMGTRTIEAGDWLGWVRDQHSLLCKFRDDGRIPSAHLLEDIRIYEFILNAPDAKQKAAAYFEKMHELRSKRGTFVVRKMEAAKELGWVL